ncbi:MAG TPA: DUF47 family protein [Clostridiales bacterium]|nr:DUF47 family protein [Clostridiales bacterium]
MFSFFKKKKKSDSFFDMLTRQARIVRKGLKLLHEYCLYKDEEIADEIIKTELEGDMARRVLIDEIDKTFITPIDREDLFKLSSNLDEVLDYAKTSVDEIRLFGITPNEEMVEVTAVLLNMTEHIILAISHMEKNPSIAEDEAIFVKGLENKVGNLTVRALATLFDSDDFNMIFKYREIYRHLNRTADVADLAMDSLLRILVKHS